MKTRIAVALLLATPSIVAQDPIAQERQRAEIRGLIRALDSQDPKTWQPAMEDLTRLREPTIDPLLARLHLQDEDGEFGRVRALQILGRFGADAARATATMVAVLPDVTPKVQRALVLALAEVGPYAPDQGPRIRAAMVELVQSDPSLQGVQPTVARLMRQHVQQFEGAWRTFARTLIDPRAPAADLAVALEHGNPFVREFAAELLAQPRRRSAEALAALDKALRAQHPEVATLDDGEDPNPGEAMSIDIHLDKRIRFLVARAMVRMAPADDRSLRAFEFLLERSTTSDRLEGVTELRRAGANAVTLLPQLLRMMQREDPTIRREAITVVGMIGPPARSALPLLERLSTDSDPQIATRARAARRQIAKE